MKYKALLIEEVEGNYKKSVQELESGNLPDNEVLIKVEYSSLNYKDALSASGNKGVTKNFPHTPGIDAVGVVESNKSSTWNKGDNVLVTGFDLGMNTPGGFAEYICVPADWILPLPSRFTAFEAMIMGTAGLTAAQSIDKIVQSRKPEDGTILVTGGTGGVGSLAIAILAHLGYTVTTISGKAEKKAFLEEIGASTVLSRNEFLQQPDKALMPSIYSGIVDTVGGEYLSRALRASKLHAVAACCGNIGSAQLDVSIYPFILRGVSLHGVSSQNCPMDVRKVLWENLSNEWKPASDILNKIANVINLEELPEKINAILKGGHVGRTVVKL